VLGLGTQGDRAAAEDFLADAGGASYPLLWDGSAESWRDLGITGQPAGILFTSDGAEVRRWSGPIPEAEVLALAAGLTPTGSTVGG
jgi:hypothetical protein